MAVEPIEVIGVGTIGYGFAASDGTGALPDTGFSVGTNLYTIVGVWVGTGSGAGNLFFSLTSALTATDKAKLVLHVDGSSDSLAFSVPTPDANHNYEGCGSFSSAVPERVHGVLGAAR